MAHVFNICWEDLNKVKRVLDGKDVSPEDRSYATEVINALLDALDNEYPPLWNKVGGYVPYLRAVVWDDTGGEFDGGAGIRLEYYDDQHEDRPPFDAESQDLWTEPFEAWLTDRLNEEREAYEAYEAWVQAFYEENGFSPF